ncbi:hypothetical protein AGIG_G18900 [Arapaima gigas]
MRASEMRSTFHTRTPIGSPVRRDRGGRDSRRSPRGPALPVPGMRSGTRPCAETTPLPRETPASLILVAFLSHPPQGFPQNGRFPEEAHLVTDSYSDQFSSHVY